MKDQAAEATIAGIAQKVGMAGSGSAVVLGLTADWMAALAGIVVGVAGLSVQIYYKRKADRREAAQEAREIELHELRRAAIARGELE